MTTPIVVVEENNSVVVVQNNVPFVVEIGVPGPPGLAGDEASPPQWINIQGNPATNTALAALLTNYATDTELTDALLTKASINHTQAASTITDFAEAVDDRVSNLLVAGSGISLNYNDPSNILTISSTAEAAYDDEAAQDAIGTILLDSSTIDFSYADTTPSITANVIQSGLTLSNMGGNLTDTQHGSRGGGALHANATTSAAGFLSGSDKTKLDGIATSATANSSDATLLARANHTGTQLASTISDFTEASQDVIGATLTDSSSIDFTYSDAGNTITAAAIFGSTAGTVCEGNDSRLSNTRTPSGTAGGSLTGSYPNPTLGTTGVSAATYAYPTSVVVNAEGRVTSITAGSAPTGAFTTEDAQDAIGSILTDSSSVDFTYDDTANTITATVIQSGLTVSNLTGTITDGQHGSKTTGTLHAAASTSVNGFMSGADKTKLDSVNSGATANSTDTFLLARANHTGTQTAATVSDFTEAAQDAVGAALTDSSSIDFTYNDAGNTISATVLESGLTISNLSGTITDSQHGAKSTGTLHSVASTSVAGFMSSTDKTKLDGVSAGATANSSDTTLLNRANHTGTQTFSTVTGTVPIAQGGTNLTTAPASNTFLVGNGTSYTQSSFSDTLHGSRAGGALHADVTTSVSGFMTAADKTKLDGVATGATANSSDAALLARANHTGTQLSTTISDFTEAVQDVAGGLLVDSTTIDFTYNDVGNSLTAVVIPAGIDRNTVGGGALTVANGGTGSTTRNFVDLTSSETIAGVKTFSSSPVVPNATTSAQAAAFGQLPTRSSLSAAASGANSDITSLSGLTTPLSVAQGGTGSATQNFVDVTTDQTIGGIKTFTSAFKQGTVDGASTMQFNTTTSGTSGVLINVDPISTSTNVDGIFRYFRNYNSGTGLTYLAVCKGDGTTSENARLAGSGNSYLAVAGNCGIGTLTPGTKCQVTGGMVVTASSAAATSPGSGNLTVVGTTRTNSFATALTALSASTTLVVGTHQFVSVDASGAARTITLPTSVGNTGITFTIKRISSGANAVTVATTSSQTIDGATTATLSAQWASITVISDGANWLLS